MKYRFTKDDEGEDLILKTEDVIRMWGLAAYQMSQYRLLTGRASSSSGR